MLQVNKPPDTRRRTLYEEHADLCSAPHVTERLKVHVLRVKATTGGPSDGTDDASHPLTQDVDLDVDPALWRNDQHAPHDHRGSHIGSPRCPLIPAHNAIPTRPTTCPCTTRTRELVLSGHIIPVNDRNSGEGPA